METLERDGVFTKSKIDSAIDGYLVEREEMLLDDELPIEDSYGFNSETNLAFDDMVGGLNDTIEDLGIIRIKEGDVLVDTDFYSEEYLEDIVSDLESVVERLEYLKGLE
tara:strand:+ start:570 stop:896 length:327 start_codon:yes stop_codon:yes gene_type:complete